MQNKSIIIVEDDNIIAFELQSRLEDNGYRVLGPYAYGEDLIKEFDRLKADLVLMDIHLKGQLDGIQTAEKIKQLGKIPIIYLTAYADQETLDRAKITEPFGYIIKPFEERELFTNIQIALYRNEMESKLIESEKNYRNIYDNAIEGIFRNCLEGKYLQVNNAMANILGYVNPKELIDLSTNNKNQVWYNSKDRESYLDILFKKEKVYNLEYEFKKNNGCKIWISISSQLVKDDSGNAIYIEGFIEDITKRKNAETVLIENERKYRALLENASIGIIVIQGKDLKFVNNNILSLTGYSIDEALSTPFNQYIHPDHKEMVMDYYIKRMNGETVPSSYNIQIVAKDKSYIWVEINGEIVEWENELAIMHFMIDISDRKKSEESLLKLNSAIQNVKEVVFITDINGIITYINAEFTNLYGFTPYEVIGKVTPRIFKSENTTTKYYTNFWSSLLNKERVFIEYVNKTKDGRYIVVESSAEPILNDDGKIIGFIGIQRDISDRKLAEKALRDSEEKYRALVENSLEGVVILDLEGNIIFANQFIAKIIEVTDSNLLIGHNVFKFLNSDSIIKSEADFANVINGIDSYLAVYEASTLSGKKIWIESIGKQINYEDKPAIILSIRDVTERILAEFEIEKQNKEIEAQYDEYIKLNEVLRHTNYHLENALLKSKESDRLKTAFLQNISHEIRTPLNEIIGLSSFLSREKLNEEEVNEIIDDLKSSSNRLTETISSVIDISMIETEQLKPHLSNFSLNAVISDVITYFSADINKKNLNLILNYDIDSEFIIFSDENILIQILSNLISNAIKFTQLGFIEVSYETKNNEVQFSVKDSGIGIADEFRTSIFKVFEQADSSLSRGYEGIGLGLPICKGLTRLLGGKIWFETNYKEGSAFYFTIPYYKEEDFVGTESDTNEQLNKKNLTKILVVEDNWSSFHYLNKILTYNHYTIIHAENGMRAVDFVKRIQDIDIVLMDMNMPIMNGYEATTMIKKIKPYLPVIAQTVCSSEEEVKNIYSAGCDDYLSKPIDADVLYSVINKYKK